MSPRNWQDGPEGGTPINAANLNGMEDDIELALAYELKMGTVTTGTPASASLSAKTAEGQFLNLVLPTDTDFGYLFANFTNNLRWGEKLSLFYSADGKTVTGGAANPVYTDGHNTSGSGLSLPNSLRDPSTLKIGNTWFTVYTVNNGYNKVFGVISSRDLVNWTALPDINVSSLPNLNQGWAPELVRDLNGDVYVVFSQVTSGDIGSLYRVKATDYSLTAWSAPVLIAFVTPPGFAIDADFMYHDGKWWMFYSNYGVMERAWASTLTGTYTIDKTGDWAGWGSGLEGPIIIKINANLYRMYLDRFSTGQGYAYTESTDLTVWTSLVSVALGPDWKPGQFLRHGSVIKLDDAASELTVLGATVAGFPQLQHVEYSGSLTMADTAVVPIGNPALDVSKTTDGDFITVNGAGKYTFKGAGNYDITATFTVTAGSGVTRTFANFKTGAGTTLQRQAGAAEDVWTLTVQNYRATAGEQVLIDAFQDSAGSATVAVRLKITRTGR